ncbi:hypothetical protein [Neptunicella sp. SCSIO 80796]|uniref:hypothetical protein n=1 Tax=Neptunicella plasticusilytica TaxID=3117012 RepID=UPI003A4E16A1
MYRFTNRVSRNFNKSNSNQKQQAQQENDGTNPVQKNSQLERVVIITDYDSGEPVTLKLELFKTDRIDCYKVFVDGRLWKERIGWSNILIGIRKALPRLLRVLMTIIRS